MNDALRHCTVPDSVDKVRLFNLTCLMMHFKSTAIIKIIIILLIVIIIRNEGLKPGYPDLMNGVYISAFCCLSWQKI